MDFSGLSFGVGTALAASQLPALAQILIVGVELIAPMLFAWKNYDATREKRSGKMEKLHEEFDFIIVGSGSAGSVLINKLSERYKVLVLEAGGSAHPMTRIPLMTYFLHGIGAVDWKWRTVPQKNACLGLQGNVSFWPSGKGLGGSSNINGMIFIRGNVQGFDTVANLSGNHAWRTENMLKIYKELEDYHGYFDDGNTHGKGGRLSIEKSHMHKCTIQLLKAAKEMGYKVRDPNAYGPVTDGFAPMDFYLKNGRRWSAFEGFLRDIIDSRALLTVRKYATVTKVLLDERNRAYGVEYYQDGVKMRAHASKEVILSAGSIQSAKILMLSGIGPKEDLESIGIESRVDLPVGKILQDKYGVFLGPFISAPKTSFLRERDINIPSFLNWLMSGKGPLQCSRSEATYTWASSYAKKHNYDNYPDLHTYFLAWSVDERYEKDMATTFNVKREVSRKYYSRAKGRDGFFQMVSLNKVFGTGTLKLKSKDSFEMPLLDPKYLENKRDVEALVEGIKFAVNLVENTTAFSEINAKLLPGPFPGCEKIPYRSDAYWECYARQVTVSAYKYSATAPIGKNKNDPEAVVDSYLRVFGTRGLRVIDGSVLQVRQLSVNHVTIQAVASFAAKFITEEWREKERDIEDFKSIQGYIGSNSLS